MLPCVCVYVCTCVDVFYFYLFINKLAFFQSYFYLQQCMTALVTT